MDRNRRRAAAIRIIFALCLTIGAVSHASILYRHGIGWTYGGRSALTVAFWTSLTLLDPVAALLLLMRPRIGLAATLVIMIADVAHNLVVAGPADLRVIDQMVFLTAVLVAIQFVWRHSPSRGLRRCPAAARRPC